MSSFYFAISVESNVAEVLQEKDGAIERILEEWGSIIEAEAVNIITENGRVRDDVLRGSITHEVDMDEESVTVGTNVEYAIYNELGTGIYIGGGRSTPWHYRDEKTGKWYTTHGMKGIHFLLNACENNKDACRAIAEAELQTE